MKKILLKGLIITSLFTASSLFAEKQTVEEMLNKSFSQANLVEEDNKYPDFIPSEYMDSELNEQQQELLKKMYLYYLRQVKAESDNYSLATEKLKEEIKPLFDQLSQESSYLTIVNSKNQEMKLIDNRVYYVDIENERIYTKNLENFANMDFKNKYRLILNMKYNRLAIIEPKNLDTNYLTLLNLSKIQDIEFKHIIEMLEYFFENKQN